jgi:protein-disulfide isomerase
LPSPFTTHCSYFPIVVKTFRSNPVANKIRASNRPFGAIIAVIAIAGVGFLGYLVSRPAQVITLDPSTLPSIAAAGILKGDPNAPVQILEFGDFECPGCGQYALITGPDVMKRLVETGEVSFRFFDFPLTDIHPNSAGAHNAAHCANEQGKFWEMHDQLFGGQHEWNGQVTRSPKRIFRRYADAIGLDGARWDECYDSGRMLAQINANRNEGQRLRVSQTPTFIIGGQLVVGAKSYDQIRALVLQAKVNAAMTQPGDRVPVQVP